MKKCAVIIIALASGAAAAERRHVSEVWSPEQTAAAGWVHRGNSSAAPPPHLLDAARLPASTLRAEIPVKKAGRSAGWRPTVQSSFPQVHLA